MMICEILIHIAVHVHIIPDNARGKKKWCLIFELHDRLMIKDFPFSVHFCMIRQMYFVFYLFYFIYLIYPTYKPGKIFPLERASYLLQSVALKIMSLILLWTHIFLVWNVILSKTIFLPSFTVSLRPCFVFDSAGSPLFSVISQRYICLIPWVAKYF